MLTSYLGDPDALLRKAQDDNVFELANNVFSNDLT